MSLFETLIHNIMGSNTQVQYTIPSDKKNKKKKNSMPIGFLDPGEPIVGNRRLITSRYYPLIGYQRRGAPEIYIHCIYVWLIPDNIITILYLPTFTTSLHPTPEVGSTILK